MKELDLNELQLVSAGIESSTCSVLFIAGFGLAGGALGGSASFGVGFGVGAAVGGLWGGIIASYACY